MATLTLPPRGSGYLYAGSGVENRAWFGNKVDWIWGDTTAASRVTEKEPLRIAYFIPHHNVTGGMKMIMQQIAQLKARGHWVQAAFRSPDSSSPVLPPWAPVQVDSTRLLGMQESMTELFRGATPIDVIMVGYFTQLLEFKDITECPGPILYWDQGHEHVFGDPTAAPDWDAVWHSSMHLPLPLLSVSVVIRDVLAAHYLRDAPVVPNAIDCSAFRPSPIPTRSKRGRGWRQAPRPAKVGGEGHTALGPERFQPLSDGGLKRVLLVGNPGLKLKNFKAALDALNIVQRDLQTQGHPGISVTWICQVQPALTGVAFPVSFAVNPPQEHLPTLYASGHDVFLFTSVYEAWGMPVLEAMASGVPVVAARCHGVDTFAFHDHNALLADPYDCAGLAAAVTRVLSSPELAGRLATQGRAMAEALTWDNSMAALEGALYQVSHFLGPPGVGGEDSKLFKAVVAHNARVDAEGGEPAQRVHLPSAAALRGLYAERLAARLSLLQALKWYVVDVNASSGMWPFDAATLQAAPAQEALQGGCTADAVLSRSRPPPSTGTVAEDEALWRTLPDGTTDGLASGGGGRSVYRGSTAPVAGAFSAGDRVPGHHNGFADSQLSGFSLGASGVSLLGGQSPSSSGADAPAPSHPGSPAGDESPSKGKLSVADL